MLVEFNEPKRTIFQRSQANPVSIFLKTVFKDHPCLRYFGFLLFSFQYCTVEPSATAPSLVGSYGRGDQLTIPFLSTAEISGSNKGLEFKCSRFRMGRNEIIIRSRDKIFSQSPTWKKETEIEGRRKKEEDLFGCRRKREKKEKKTQYGGEI